MDKKEEKKLDALDSTFADFISKLGAEIKKHKEEHVSESDIKFPLEISGVKFYDRRGNKSPMSQAKIGDLVSVRPCDEKYNNKTYLGIYLGDLPIDYTYELHIESKVLNIHAIGNPAMYVFELKEIIYGCGSYWGKIKSIDDFKKITNEDIENVWYVKLLKKMYQEDADSGKEEEVRED